MGTIPITSTALRALRVLCAVQVVRVQAVVPLRTAARRALGSFETGYLVAQIRRRQDGDGVDWGVGGSSAAAAMMRPHKSS